MECLCAKVPKGLRSEAEIHFAAVSCFALAPCLVSWMGWRSETQDLWASTRNIFITGFPGYTLPVLCNCNVHPVVLLLVFAFTLVYTLLVFRDEGWHFDIVSLLHITGFQFCMCCSFTLDFTNPMKAVANGMLHSADSCNALDSPVAGRSARGFCWLAGINNWVFVGLVCWASSQLHIFPSWMFSLDTICFCLDSFPLCENAEVYIISI